MQISKAIQLGRGVLLTPLHLFAEPCRQHVLISLSVLAAELSPAMPVNACIISVTNNRPRSFTHQDLRHESAQKEVACGEPKLWLMGRTVSSSREVRAHGRILTHSGMTRGAVAALYFTFCVHAVYRSHVANNFIPKELPIRVSNLKVAGPVGYRAFEPPQADAYAGLGSSSRATRGQIRLTQIRQHRPQAQSRH